MGATIGRSIGWGALFGTIAAFASASYCAYLSASAGHNAGELTFLMKYAVPLGSFMGGIVAAVLFGVVGAIMSFEPAGIKPSALSFAVLSSLLTLGAVILPFASWMAGGWLRAIQGAQGVYLLLPTGLLPVAIAGLFVGWRVGR
jgi:hypothetical protein